MNRTVNTTATSHCAIRRVHYRVDILISDVSLHGSDDGHWACGVVIVHDVSPDIGISHHVIAVAALGDHYSGERAAIVKRVLREYAGNIPDKQSIEEIRLAVAIPRRSKST